MQLQPVVHCDVVERLGMSKSLFERYMERALMLDTQYRMVINYQNIALTLYMLSTNLFNLLFICFKCLERAVLLFFI